MSTVIAANILTLVGHLVLLYASSLKEKKRILKVQIVSMVLMSLSSFLLKGYSGVVMDVIGIIINLFAILDIDKKWISYSMIVISIIFGFVFNNHALIGLLPIIANVAQSLVILNPKTDVRAIKLVCGIGCIMWAIFAFTIMDYVGASFNVFDALSYFYHVFRQSR